MKYILIAAALLLLIVTPVAAQVEDCPATVATGIAAAASSCTNLGPNEVCYGHADVSAIVNCEEALEFDSSGDIIPLSTICALRLSPLQSSGEWGVAIMSVQPSTYPASITYALFGDIEIQNAASDVFALQVWASKDADIHAGPGSHFEVIGVLNKDETVETNACNCTGNWLRITMSDGHIGWISAMDVSILGESGDLPVVEADTPVYESMQAFTFQGNEGETTCTEQPDDGILIQAPAEVESTSLQINGTEIALTSTIFVQSIPGQHLQIETLEGSTSVTANDSSVSVPAGTRVTVPLSLENTPAGRPTVSTYNADDVKTLPLSLLPRAIDPVASLDDEIPHIVGVDACRVASDRGETLCPLYFVNADGDAITRMDVEFVRAPQGTWTSNFREPPELIDGNNTSGVLAWGGTCSLGGANFIGPVEWSITITDEDGHVSEPFAASFNCVE